MQSHTADSSAELHAAADVCLSDCSYVEGHDLDDSFKWLRQTWSEQVGSDRERDRKRVQWLSAVKEATRQALQVCFPSVFRKQPSIAAFLTACNSVVLLWCAECPLIALLATGLV